MYMQSFRQIDHHIKCLFNTNMKYTSCFLVLLLFLYAAATGCSRGETEKSIAARQPADSEPHYETIKISAQEIPDKVSAVGMVQAFQEVEISPEISGKIATIYYDVGDAVKRGDVLAAIDNESRVISLQQKQALLGKAQAARSKAHKDAQKSGTLFKKGVISDSESDGSILEQQVADAELKLARAELRAAKKELRDTRITAPFDGKIAVRSVERGKLVMPGQNLFTLVAIKKVKTIVHVSELDIAKIAVGDTAEVMLDSLGGALFQGRVTTIGLKADDSTRTFPVEVIIENRQEQLLPGMVTRVSIISAKPRRIILIPQKAVRPVDGMQAVYLMTNNDVEQRIIYPGAVVGNQVIIEKGLNEGDSLIVSDINTADSAGR